MVLEMYDWVSFAFAPVGLVYAGSKNPYTFSFYSVRQTPCKNLQVIS